MVENPRGSQKPQENKKEATEARGATTPISIRNVESIDTIKGTIRVIRHEHAGKPEFADSAAYWKKQITELRRAHGAGEITDSQFDSYIGTLMAEKEILSTTDLLTNLYNRRGFSDIADRLLAHAERTDEKTSLAIMDVDYFKRVNDMYGHDAGDAVLEEVAGFLRTRKRKGDIVGRWGGEEFVTLFPATNGDQALKATERVRKALPIAVERALAGTEFKIEQPINISTGVADTDSTGRELDALVSAADTALYQAKQEGRNRTVIFKPPQKS